VDQDSERLRDLMSANQAELIRRLDAQDRVAADIRAEVRATNGRVRALESKVAVLEDRSPASPLKAGGLGAFLTGCALFLWEKFGK
jgi:hypothetical protein